MAGELNCAFCNLNSEENVNIFSEENFRKCQTILRLRKLHNLKYSDVILPREYLDSGYHRSCYKTFTALKKIYYDTTKSKKQDTSQCSSEFIKHSLQQSTSQPSTSADVENIIEDVSVDSAVQEVVTQKFGQPTADAIVEDVVHESPECTSLPLDASTEDDAVTVGNMNSCIFCNQSFKKHRSKHQALHRTQKEKLESTIEEKCNLENDEEKKIYDKLKKYSGDTIYYHQICRVAFFNKSKSSNKKSVPTAWHSRRNLHQNVFEKITSLIENNVINKGRCYYLSYLHKLYMDKLQNFDGENEEMLDVTFTAQRLEDKIKNNFSGRIQILQWKHKKVIAPKGITTIDDALFAHLKDENTLQAAALILRREILNIKKKKLPENLNVQHSLQDECTTPEILTEFVGSIIGTQRIDVVFDQYFHPSIKDNERSLRHESKHAEYIISGSDQTRPADFAKEMKNIKFKETLVEFFCLHWTYDENVPFLNNKIVHLNFRQCYSYVANGNKVESQIVEDLCCELHEEVNSKIIYHACSISHEANIVIRGSDTDILVITLAYQEAFASLGDNNLTKNKTNQIFDIIQKFTCELYNLKKYIDANNARFQLFVDTYKAADINEQFSIKVRNFDGSSLPPCKSELWQLFLRAIYITNIWNNADKQHPSNLQPKEHG
ncbi:hypothetical protein PV327_011124, partial [Microctonus hyperodae]